MMDPDDFIKKAPKMMELLKKIEYYKTKDRARAIAYVEELNKLLPGFAKQIDQKEFDELRKEKPKDNEDLK